MIARALNDPAPLDPAELADIDPADAAAVTAHAAMVEGRFEDALAQLPQPKRDSVLSAAVRDYLDALCQAGVPGALDRHLEVAPELIPAMGHMASEAAMSSGQIALAEELSRRTLASTPSGHPAEAWTRIVRARALFFLGRVEESADELEAARSVPGLSDLADRISRAVSALVAGFRNERIQVIALAEQLRAEVPNPQRYAEAVPFLLVGLGLSACGLPTAGAEILRFGAGEPGLPRLPLTLQGYGYDVLVEASVANARIELAVALLAEFDQLPIERHPMASAARERSRARVTLVTDQHAASIAAAQASAASAEAVGGALYVVRAGVLRGLAEAARNEADPQAPIDLDRIADVAAHGDGTEIREWAERELAAVGRHLRIFPSIGWDQLTPAQQLVARLAARGLRNAEIAELLFLSPRTVEGHVAAVLDAVGAANRVMLGRDLDGIARTAIALPDGLTARQREVGLLLCDGLTNSAIAERLRISEKAVEKHVSALFTRLGVRSRAAVAARLRTG